MARKVLYFLYRSCLVFILTGTTSICLSGKALIQDEPGYQKEADLSGRELAEEYYESAVRQSYDLNDQISGERLYKLAINTLNPTNFEDSILMARIYYGYSYCMKRLYNYSQFNEYADLSIQIYSKDVRQNLNNLLDVQTAIVNTDIELKKYSHALDGLLKLEKIADKYLPSNDQIYIYIYRGLSNAFVGMNEITQAKHYLEKAWSLINSMQLNYYEYADLHSTEGQLNRLLNEKEKSLYHLKRCFSLYLENAGESDTYTVVSCESIGDVYLYFNQPDSALQYYHQAMVYLLENFNDPDPFSTPPIVFSFNEIRLMDLLVKKAKALEGMYYTRGKDQKYLAYALENWFFVEQLKDQARNSDLYDASHFILQDYFKSDFERSISCAYELYTITGEPGYISKAFSLMEKNKYMNLFKSLTLTERLGDINLPETIKKKQDSLKIVVNNLTYEYEMLKSADSISAEIERTLQQKLLATRQLDSIKIHIREIYPNYYDIKYDSLLKPLSAFNEFCRKQKTLGLEWYEGDQAIYVISSSLNSNTFKKIEKTNEYNEAVSSLLRIISRPPNDNTFKKDYNEFQKTATLVYDFLLDDLVTDHQKISRILIIPDGILAELPFDILLTEKNPTDPVDYSRLPYLIKTHTIGYAYSANLLLNDFNDQNQADGELLGFSYSSTASSIINDEYRSNNELPNAAIELKSINKFFKRGKTDLFFNTNATKSVFLENASRYRILHLAVHGEADTTEVIKTHLRFKPADAMDEDYILYLHELYTMDLSNTDLAVLSACETGLGRHYAGEGAFSMARGFAFAGCPSIVMSLWKANDKSTAAIMGEFYRHLRIGEDMYQSLREAKLAYLKGADKITAHPANWSAFVSVGKQYPLYKNYRFPAYAAAIFLTLLSAGLLLGSLVKRIHLFRNRNQM